MADYEPQKNVSQTAFISILVLVVGVCSIKKHKSMRNIK